MPKTILATFIGSNQKKSFTVGILRCDNRREGCGGGIGYSYGKVDYEVRN